MNKKRPYIYKDYFDIRKWVIFDNKLIVQAQIEQQDETKSNLIEVLDPNLDSILQFKHKVKQFSLHASYDHNLIGCFNQIDNKIEYYKLQKDFILQKQISLKFRDEKCFRIINSIRQNIIILNNPRIAYQIINNDGDKISFPERKTFYHNFNSHLQSNTFLGYTNDKTNIFDLEYLQVIDTIICNQSKYLSKNVIVGLSTEQPEIVFHDLRVKKLIFTIEKDNYNMHYDTNQNLLVYTNSYNVKVQDLRKIIKDPEQIHSESIEDDLEKIQFINSNTAIGSTNSSIYSIDCNKILNNEDIYFGI